MLTSHPCSIADFLKELPIIVRKTEPLLRGVIEKSQPLERAMKLRELQTSYVYTTVLAKKCRVSSPSVLGNLSERGHLCSDCTMCQQPDPVCQRPLHALIFRGISRRA